MLKLAVLALALFSVALCDMVITGNFRGSNVDDEVMDIANWTTDKISKFTGLEGVHSIANIVDVKTQVVAGKCQQMVKFFCCRLE